MEKNLKKNIYIYIYTHTHTHTYSLNILKTNTTLKINYVSVLKNKVKG